jgi:hypothetical protein
MYEIQKGILVVLFLLVVLLVATTVAATGLTLAP